MGADMIIEFIWVIMQYVIYLTAVFTPRSFGKHYHTDFDHVMGLFNRETIKINH